MDPLELHLRRQLEHSRDFFWHRLRWEAVRSHLPADRPFELVDIGAGAGLLGEYLGRDLPQARYGFVEPIAFLEEDLTRRFGADANARGEGAYPGRQFATLLDVLEHQDDDRAFLADLISRLDHGAILVVTVPAYMRLWSQWDVALGHFRRYTKASFARRVEGLDVDVVELSYLFPEMLPPAMVRRRARSADDASSEQAESGSAEFPDVPRPVNEMLFRIGMCSLSARHVWPAGTSLLVVLRRR